MSNNKQQTAVEWLIKEHFGGIENCTPDFRHKIEQAKEMEAIGKEMSYDDGYAEGYKRALELTQWTISNLIPPHNESNS
jgi:hypothetical protein